MATVTEAFAAFGHAWMQKGEFERARDQMRQAFTSKFKPLEDPRVLTMIIAPGFDIPYEDFGSAMAKTETLRGVKLFSSKDNTSFIILNESGVRVVKKMDSGAAFDNVELTMEEASKRGYFDVKGEFGDLTANQVESYVANFILSLSEQLKQWYEIRGGEHALTLMQERQKVAEVPTQPEPVDVKRPRDSGFFDHDGK